MRAVLMYHSIDDSGSVISVAPKVFAEHVAWLRRSGIRVLPLDALVAMDPTDRGDAIALTFDDGFLNFGAAARVLEDHDLPATIFVVTSHVGRTNAWGGREQRGVPTLPLLGWSDLEALCAQGFGVGAHTHTHAVLTGLSRSRVEEEMEQCAIELDRRLGRFPRSLSYPYGAVNAAVAALAATRFDTAVTTEFAALSPGDSAVWIPRLDMYYFRHPRAIQRLGYGSLEWWVNWVRWRRRARETMRPHWRPEAVWR